MHKQTASDERVAPSSDPFQRAPSRKGLFDATDRQPFYHLEKLLKHRAQVTASRQTMARVSIEVHRALQPLVNSFKDRIIEYDVALLDATGLQDLKEPGRARGVSSSVNCVRGGAPPHAVIVYVYNALAHKRFLREMR